MEYEDLSRIDEDINAGRKAFETISEAFTISDLRDEDSKWVRANTQTPVVVDRMGLWQFVYYCYTFRGPVSNIVNNLTTLTGEPEVVFEDDGLKREWEQVSVENHFPVRWTRIIRNAFLFNDFFTVVKPVSLRGVAVRHLPPYQVERVLTVDGDPETLEGVRVRGSNTTIPAEQIVHHVVDRVSNDVRGTPLFSRCLRELVYVYRWLEDLYYLGHIRARLPVVRKLAGGSAAVAGEKSRLQYLPGPGRMVIENKGGDWEFPPAYKGTGDAREGYEVFISAIAAAFNLPYFLVSGDYRNNSLASTLSADSPTVRLIRWYRRTFEGQFLDILRKALRVQNLAGVVEIRWPPVIERDKQRLAQAYEILARNGAVSSETMYRDVIGGDWDTEHGRIEAEMDAEDHRWGLGRRQQGAPGSGQGTASGGGSREGSTSTR